MYRGEKNMLAEYDLSLVTLSYIISVIGSYAALVLAKRGADPYDENRWFCMIGAAIALGGVAIWSMHFIGMLAYKLTIPVSYDLWLTGGSLAVAVLMTGLGLFIVSRRYIVPLPSLLLAGVIMGAGVVAMHYLGIAAMRMDAAIRHQPLIVVVACAIAIFASTSALWLAFNLYKPWQQIISAFIMGVAVAGMHYTAMLGMHVMGTVSPLHKAKPMAISSDGLAVCVIALTLVILGVLTVNPNNRKRSYSKKPTLRQLPYHR
jgi:NO-binding membrane sensor protein with MHYT domain